MGGDFVNNFQHKILLNLIYFRCLQVCLSLLGEKIVTDDGYIGTTDAVTFAISFPLPTHSNENMHLKGRERETVFK